MINVSAITGYARSDLKCESEESVSTHTQAMGPRPHSLTQQHTQWEEELSLLTWSSRQHFVRDKSKMRRDAHSQDSV